MSIEFSVNWVFLVENVLFFDWTVVGTAQSAVSFSRKKKKRVTFNEPVTKKSKTVKEKKRSKSTTTVQSKNKTFSITTETLLLLLLQMIMQDRITHNLTKKFSVAKVSVESFSR